MSERLTDAWLTAMERVAKKDDCMQVTTEVVPEAMLLLIAELHSHRQSRAAGVGLTMDEVTALGFAHGIVKCLRFDTDISKKLQADALAVLDRLLGGGK